MKAKAAIFMGPGVPFEVREFEVTETPAGYGRSELIASGVCGTDLHFMRGTLFIQPPAVIGHEFVGRLTGCDEAEAAEYGLKAGDNVIADIAVPCGNCLLCRTGDDANCVDMQLTNGGSIDEPPYRYGGYAEVNYTPLSNLIKIPDALDPLVAAAFACPGPTAVHAVRLALQAGVPIGPETVAVVQGLGPVGSFAVAYLRSFGVNKLYAVTAGDNPRREELALELGADEVLNLDRDGKEAVTQKIQARRRPLFRSIGSCVSCAAGHEYASKPRRVSHPRSVQQQRRRHHTAADDHVQSAAHDRLVAVFGMRRQGLSRFPLRA